MRFFKRDSAFLTSTLFIAASFWGATSHAVIIDTQVSISLKPNALPADDLIYQGKTLSSVQALALRNEKGVDLSTLQPDDKNDLWKSSPQDKIGAQEDAQLGIDDTDIVQYEGDLNTGNITDKVKFNVSVTKNGASPQNFAVMLGKTMHTYLLRKELLRKLGYRVPAMKHFKRLKVRFATSEEKTDFIKRQFLETFSPVNADPARWIVPTPDEPDARITTFQDVVAMEATTLYYNLALGPPTTRLEGAKETRPQTGRILRALSLVYGLVNVPESVNSVEWSFGQTQNQSVIFKLPINANFACGYEDALWLLRKLAELKEEDFDELVKGAAFPEPVGQVLAERLKQRRNSIMRRFKVSTETLSYDPKLSNEEGTIEKSKVIQHKWAGYASEFAGDDIESPFQHLRHYALSMAESELISNLVSKANSSIPQLNIQNQTTKHFAQMSQTYFSTGQPQQMPIKAWTAPLIDGGFDLSRNVVLGNYMGTNNLVQLADTFGLHLNFGLMIGIDHLPTMVNGQGLIQGGVSISVTHIKPITKVKQALTEPLQNAFVPWVFGNAQKILKNVNELTPGEGDTRSATDVDDAVAAELVKLKKYLGKGESLILTESLTGLEQVSAGLGLPVPIGPAANLTLGSNQLVLSRIQIFRKDENTILVFKDRGRLLGFTLGLGANVSAGNYQIPILNISVKKVTGVAKTKIFRVNIYPSKTVNPTVFQAAHAVAQTIRTGSTELLQVLQCPKGATISTQFKDRSSMFQLAHLVRRTLKTQGNIHVDLADGNSGDFIALTNGKQKGKNYQLFASQLANYFVQKMTGDPTYSFVSEAAPNPGQTFLGRSHTRDAQFQAALIPELSDPLIGVQYRWEGWSLQSHRLENILTEINDKFHANLFSPGQLHDAKALQLYNITLNLNIYESGIKKILSMSPEKQAEIETKYQKENHCVFGFSEDCAAIGRFHDQFESFRAGIKDPKKLARTTFAIVSNLEEFVDFSDLTQIIKATDKDFYLYSTINGAQKGSEFVDPINSDTVGKIPNNVGDGVLNFVQNILGIDAGEFQAKWLREVL